MKTLLFAMPGNESFCGSLARLIPSSVGGVGIRRFPDGESHVRVDSDVLDASVAVVCTLDRPDDKLVPLLFLARALKDSGARRVGLIAPYLAYMRQDRRFAPGEALSAAYFADLISRHFDWLVTVDPHLHRIASLEKIYSIPAVSLAAAPFLAGWVRSEVSDAVLIGPDEESAQWVAAVGESAGMPFATARKTRRGDRDVTLELPDLETFRGRRAVIVDDIISTATTLSGIIPLLEKSGFSDPLCLAIHPVFCDGAETLLRRSGAADIVTCNTIPHATNRIDLSVPAAVQAGLFLYDQDHKEL